MALILRKLLSGVSKNVTGAKLILINAVVGSLAGGTASFLNTFFMRRVEMKNGIEIFEDEGLTQKISVDSGTTPLKSIECARKAIFETAFSRVFLAVTCFMSPALIFYAVEKAGRTPRRPATRIPFEIMVFMFALMGGLPASIALFPQTGALPKSALKSEFQGRLPERVQTVYYNKGM
jgi:hypothetical protein